MARCLLSSLGQPIYYCRDLIIVNKTKISGKIETEILAKCDLCHNDPCRNGASCRPLPNRDYECACAPGFYGKNCDAVIDACYGNPCTNGATCKVLEAGRLTCVCPQGYSGVRYVAN